ncbi:MAG TPA: uracil-DNA glycosylase [Nitrospiria bacterium]|nr:uracil-DNA glycosylase [Nitrospiria bacterium]
MTERSDSSFDLLDQIRARIAQAREMGVEAVPRKTSPAEETRPTEGSAPLSLFGAPLEEVDLSDRSDRPMGTDGAPASLEAVREELGECTRCKLHATRTTIVFGTGNPKARLVFVGEGPGEEEDLQGKPFVGRAGQLLTRIIVAMGLTRDEVYIANIIKCRPPKNRNPQPDEIAACEPFLIRQLACIRPRVICALGTFSAQTLLSTTQKITQLRGRFHNFHGIKLMPTFHPAYLLRNPHEKKTVWEDMQKIMEELKSP